MQLHKSTNGVARLLEYSRCRLCRGKKETWAALREQVENSYYRVYELLTYVPPDFSTFPHQWAIQSDSDWVLKVEYMSMYLGGKSGGLPHEDHTSMAANQEERDSRDNWNVLTIANSRELTLKSALKQVWVSAVDDDVVKARSTDRDFEFCIKT